MVVVSDDVCSGGPQMVVVSDDVCFGGPQMVVVSDDVHEYAVALKDTEEKIARCPSRVRNSSPLHKPSCGIYTLCTRAERFGQMI